MSLEAYFRAMARNNAWSNRRLLAACGQLPPEALRAPRAGFFPSLWLTLSHILLVDGYYLDALHGILASPEMDEAVTPWTTLPELRDAQAASDARLIAFCDALQPEGLAREIVLDRGGGVHHHERVERALAHLLMHQVHHRGQAHAMLSSTGVPPPQLDEFLLANDAPLRAGELAALGFDEAQIWGR
jgi:uncharacterized damage-inducible protein DinB